MQTSVAGEDCAKLIAESRTEILIGNACRKYGTGETTRISCRTFWTHSSAREHNSSSSSVRQISPGLPFGEMTCDFD